MSDITFNPNNISVLKQEDESILILLNFPEIDTAISFMRTYVEDKNVELAITTNQNKEYVLSLQVVAEEFKKNFIFNSHLTQEHYDSFKYLHEGRKAAFSCGTRNNETNELQIFD